MSADENREVREARIYRTVAAVIMVSAWMLGLLNLWGVVHV